MSLSQPIQYDVCLTGRCLVSTLKKCIKWHGMVHLGIWLHSLFIHRFHHQDNACHLRAEVWSATRFDRSE
jgi:hypothetical protein